MSTDPTVPKALSAIQASEQGGELTATDRKLFNWLLAVAYPTLRENVEFKVLTADVRAYLGSHESNDRVIAAVERLSNVRLRLDYFAETDEERRYTGPLIVGDTPKQDGVIFFQFPERLKPMLAEPAMYARLRLAVMGQFRSKYAVVLYELLELYSNRDRPVWTVTIEDLRALVGVGDKMRNFKDFRSRVLDPALQEINDKADLTAEVEEVRDGRRVATLIFRVTKKDARAAFEAELRHKAVKDRPRRRRQRDGATPDLLDGRTDRERGGPPWLKAATIEAARQRFPGWDIEQFERQWVEAQEGREPARDPDKAFLAWLERTLQGRSLL
jgi:hypothetical protein